MPRIRSLSTTSSVTTRPQSHSRWTSPDPLVGRFFHSFHPEHEHPKAPMRVVKWQGQVFGRIDDHTYLIELYSWSDGRPNGQKLQPLAGMGDWKFYATDRDMNEWYEETYTPIMKHYDFGVE